MKKLFAFLLLLLPVIVSAQSYNLLPPQTYPLQGTDLFASWRSPGPLKKLTLDSLKAYIGHGSGGSGTVTSISATSPIIVTPSPITTTGTISIQQAGAAQSGFLSSVDWNTFNDKVSSFSSGDLSPLFTTTVLTATSTPALSFTQISQNANLVFAGPSSGGPSPPTFRLLTASDVPPIATGGVGNNVTVIAATTGSINLSNPGTAVFDGVTVSSGDSILVWKQSTSSQNGVYVFNGASSALTRAPSSDDATELNNQIVSVESGSTYADHAFSQVENVITINTDPVQYIDLGVSSAVGRPWTLNGNANTPAGNKLGSTNNRTVRLYTNNVQRGQFTNTGLFQWGSSNQFSVSTGGALTLNGAASSHNSDDSMLVWKASSGLVGYRPIPSGGGSSTLHTSRIAFGDGSNVITDNSKLTYASSAVNIINAPAANTTQDGLILKDTVAATSGNQQKSGAIHFTGQGWKTNSTAASQSVDWLQELTPIQGSAHPSSLFQMKAANNGGSYLTVFAENDSGGVVLGDNAVSNYGKFINVFGNGNTVSTSVTPGLNLISFVYGFNNTANQGSSGSSATYILGETNSATGGSGKASLLLGFNNSTAGSAVHIGDHNTGNSGFSFGSTNTTASALDGMALGTSNTLGGGYAFGRSNTANAGYEYGYAVGSGNTVNANGFSSTSNSGAVAVGYYNTISAGSFVDGMIMTLGSGMTMASNNLNTGTINFGWNNNTGNRPSLQFKGNAVNVDAGQSTFNQLNMGTDVTASGFDPLSSGTITVAQATTLSAGSIASETASGGSALFTWNAAITGIITGERVTVVFTGGTYTNGDYYFLRNTSTTFFLCDTRAHALAGTNKVADGGTCTATVTPVQRTPEQMASGTAALYVKANGSSNASFYQHTEAGVDGVLGTVIYKTTSGDPTGYEGMFEINTADNAAKIYAEGAWRTIASW